MASETRRGFRGAAETGDAGVDGGINKITDYYGRAQTETAHVKKLVAALQPAQMVSIEANLKVVRGAAFQFSKATANATNWVIRHGRTFSLSSPTPEATVNSYAETMNISLERVGRDTADPGGDEKKLATKQLETGFAAAEQSLQALQSGRTDETARLVIWLREIAGVAAKTPVALGPYRNRLKVMVKSLDVAVETHEDLKTQLGPTGEVLDQLVKK